MSAVRTLPNAPVAQMGKPRVVRAKAPGQDNRPIATVSAQGTYVHHWITNRPLTPTEAEEVAQALAQAAGEARLHGEART